MVINPVLSDDRLLSDFLGEHHCFIKQPKIVDKLDRFGFFLGLFLSLKI